MILLDGKKIADEKLHRLRENIVTSNIEVALAVILVGDDPASHIYVSLKEKTAKKIGIEVRKYIFDENVSFSEIDTCIKFLNNDKYTNAIIVQLPLPEHLRADKVISLIDLSKDVDGFHPINQDKFLAGDDVTHPVFPRAIMALALAGVEETHVACDIKHVSGKAKSLPLHGMKAVVVGKSDVFDRVMTHALVREGAEAEFVQVTLPDANLTKDDLDKIKKADIVVSAVGVAEFLHGELFKDNAIVIDGGISKVDDKTVGDVDVDSCKDCDIILSSVPGGVGPVTIACLLENAVELAVKQADK